jgi:acetylglutamate kinase
MSKSTATTEAEVHNMNITNAQRAEILTQALPYIQNYYNKVVVIKYGGNAMVNQELKEQVMGDLVLLSLVGMKVVLVHGGGPEITELLHRMGKKSEFVDGLRVTDQETADVVQMVLAGKISKSLVNLLEMKGGKAMGISGMDGRMIEAKMKDPRLGYVGEITHVNVEPIYDLLEKGYIPVISTVGCDREGNVYNINADTAAAWIAGALQAESLITMTDIAGILADPSDPDSLIKKIDLDDAKELFKKGIVSGGMIPKVECCVNAIIRGVSKVFILDGRIPHAILLETLTNEGAGTMVVKKKR